MVKKLFKYEIIYYLRTLMPFELVLLGMSLLIRISQFFEGEEKIYGIMNGFSIFGYVMAIIVCFVLLFIVSITRFYKNLFKNEGYLMFTLPVTASEHLWVKVLTAILFGILTVINVAISIMVATAGELCGEIFKAAAYLIKDAAAQIGTANLIFYIIEYVLLLMIASATGYMLYYACISVGQLARKNRVLAAVGVYFGYSAVMQLLSSILMTVFSAFFANTDFIDNIELIIGNLTQNQVYLLIHGVMLLAMAFSAVGFAIYFLVSKYVISNKLNLE